MEFPSPYPLNMTKLATAAVDSDSAWHVVGLLLGRRRPARPSDLPLPPDLIRFLCSIPDSPLRLAGGDLVTLSQIGVAALVHFFANSDLVTRYLDLPQIVPRLLENFRSDVLVRTYFRKRKRAAAEIEDFPKIKRKSFFQDLDCNHFLNSHILSLNYLYFLRFYLKSAALFFSLEIYDLFICQVQ